MYDTIVDITTRLSLKLEHNKNKLFHFTRSPRAGNLPLDLGFAPFTGATPLQPKKYWRYLGIFFNCRLMFKEHVRFYSTKALTTVKAMRMFGNSSRGLEPKHKRLLYRSCVLPIATYGARIWFYDGH